MAKHQKRESRHDPTGGACAERGEIEEGGNSIARRVNRQISETLYIINYGTVTREIEHIRENEALFPKYNEAIHQSGVRH